MRNTGYKRCQQDKVNLRIVYTLLPFFSENGYTVPGVRWNYIKVALRVHEEISSQSLGVEAPGWQGANAQEYLDIPSFRNEARRDASAHKM